ncbi:MAG: viologen exporter family transport system permease protein [Eubacteriales bacterium]|nr:viologen exporter family transport system permease protein [Eubacteriales bacterium]
MFESLRHRFALAAALVRLEFINNLAYRATYFTGVFNYGIQIGAYYFLWDAVFAGRRLLAGFTREEMLTYVIVAWVVRSFYFSNLDRRVAVEIRNGDIAMELILPYDYQEAKYCRAFGEALFRLLFFTLPTGIVIYLLRPFQLPPNFTAGFLFILSMLGSFLINAQLSLMAGLLAFFTQSTSGIYRAKRVIMDLCTGLLIPISFYPEWFQKVLAFLPFQAVSYLPNLIYLGKVDTAGALAVLARQFFWAVVLFFLGRLFWRLAVRHLVIQGG